jgi:hypothetical protein
MGKLFNLKKWLTLPDTARHLTLLFGEDVTEADVLRLALDGHLRLSVNFVNSSFAMSGKTVPIAEAKYQDVRALDGVGTVRLYHGPVLLFNGVGHVFQYESTVCLQGVYDLTMLGAERLDIEHEFQRMTDGPEVTSVYLNGVFVEGVGGQMFQLRQSSNDNEEGLGSYAKLMELKKDIADHKYEPAEAERLLSKHEEDRKKFFGKKEKKGITDGHYPTNLPEDGVLVVRTDALRKFEQALIEEQSKPDKPLNTTERNTLLTIIAALCDHSKIDRKAHGSATQIARLTENLGASVSDDAVRKALNKISDAVESRNK